MSTNSRWIIGPLLVLVIGLGVALAIVAGDDGGGSDPVTLPTITEQTSETETQAPTVTTQPSPTETDSSGGVAPPGE